MARSQSLSKAAQTLRGHTMAVLLTSDPVLLSAGGLVGSGCELWLRENKLVLGCRAKLAVGLGCGQLVWVSQLVLKSDFHFLWKSHTFGLLRLLQYARILYSPGSFGSRVF